MTMFVRLSPTSTHKFHFRQRVPLLVVMLVEWGFIVSTRGANGATQPLNPPVASPMDTPDVRYVIIV